MGVDIRLIGEKVRFNTGIHYPALRGLSHMGIGNLVRPGKDGRRGWENERSQPDRYTYRGHSFLVGKRKAP